MIPILLRLNWLTVKRDRAALVLLFVLPVAFFSIFAMIFGGPRDKRQVEVLVLDEDKTAISQAYVDVLSSDHNLAVTHASSDAFDSAAAIARVRSGSVPAAVIIADGFGDAYGTFGELPRVELVYDQANPMVREALQGRLLGAAPTAAPDVWIGHLFGRIELLSGESFSIRQRLAVAAMRASLRGDSANGDGAPTADLSLVHVDATPARSLGAPKISDNMIPYYASGTAVLFLLFSMTGVGGTLLEDEESGTLERLLISHASMGQILFAKWLFHSVLGMIQVTLMFVWGWLFFGLNLFTPAHLAGFAAMTLVTSGAAAAFGLALAALCRSRAQLNGLSTVLILVMSAMGGSMVPRVLMPPFMQNVALLTFNGWAVDGYLKVFWFDTPDKNTMEALLDLVPQLAVLAGVTLVFLIAARMLAQRWETR